MSVIYMWRWGQLYPLIATCLNCLWMCTWFTCEDEASCILWLLLVTQPLSIAKNVGCLRRNLFVCGWVCGFVCQHDNFWTSKHRMTKLGGRCIAQRSRPSSNLGVIASRGRSTPKIWRFAESWCTTQSVNNRDGRYSKFRPRYLPWKNTAVPGIPRYLFCGSSSQSKAHATIKLNMEICLIRPWCFHRYVK